MEMLDLLMCLAMAFIGILAGEGVVNDSNSLSALEVAALLPGRKGNCYHLLHLLLLKFQ